MVITTNTKDCNGNMFAQMIIIETWKNVEDSWNNFEKSNYLGIRRMT